jgi:capsular exopolysaccharide synthesis family protein
MQAPGSSSANLDFDYIALLRGVWRRHKLLIAVTFLGIALPAALVAYWTVTPVYISKAMISIEPSPIVQHPFVKDPPRKETIATHLVLLKSRSLAEGVIDALPQDGLRELIEESQYTDYWLLLKNTVKGWLGKPPTVLSSREKAVQELAMARMEFSPLREADNVFVLTGASSKPWFARDLVSTHIQVLLNRTRTTDAEDTRRTREFLDTQYQKAKDGLARAEESLGQYERQKNRVKTGTQFESELSRLAQLETTYIETQVNRQILTPRIEATRRALQQARANVGKPAAEELRRKDEERQRQQQIDTYKKAQEHLEKLEGHLASLRVRYTDAHPSVISTQDEIVRQRAFVAQLARQLPGPATTDTTDDPKMAITELEMQLKSLRGEADALAAKEESLKLQIERLTNNVRNFSRDDAQSVGLRRSVEANRNLVMALSDKLMATKVREQGEPSVVRIVDPASLPSQPTGTKLQRLLLMIVGVAGSLAVGVAFGIELLRQPVETESDVQRATGLPVLGSVGILDPSTSALDGRSKRRPILLPDSSAGASGLRRDPIHVELYRAIRAMLETERLRSPFRTILVTSPAPHDGKSTTVLNLAHVFQEFGHRVLIIEADLRRPSLSSPLALTSKFGLVDLLRKSATWEEACRRLPSGVMLIPGQVMRGDSASLLASPQFKELLDAAAKQFDLILIDTAPVLAVPDDLLLARIVDRVIIVAKASSTTQRDLRKAQTLLENAGGQIVGVILNQANPRDVSYYHPRYRTYYTPRPDGKESPLSKRRVDRAATLGREAKRGPVDGSDRPDKAL